MEEYDEEGESFENTPNNIPTENLIINNSLISFLNMIQISKYLDRTLDSPLKDFEIIVSKAVGNRKQLDISDLPIVFESVLKYLNEKQEVRNKLNEKIKELQYNIYLEDILNNLKKDKSGLEKDKEKINTKIRNFFGKKEKNNEWD